MADRFIKQSHHAKVVHLSDDGQTARCGRTFDNPAGDYYAFNMKQCPRCGSQSDYRAVYSEVCQAEEQARQAREAAYAAATARAVAYRQTFEQDVIPAIQAALETAGARCQVNTRRGNFDRMAIEIDAGLDTFHLELDWKDTCIGTGYGVQINARAVQVEDDQTVEDAQGFRQTVDNELAQCQRWAL